MEKCSLFDWDGDISSIYNLMPEQNQCVSEFLNLSNVWVNTIYQIKKYVSKCMSNMPSYVENVFFGTTDFHYKIMCIDNQLVEGLRQVYTSLHSIDDIQLHGLYCDYMTKNQYRQEFYSTKYVIDYEPDFILYVLSRAVGIIDTEDNEDTWKFAGIIMIYLLMSGNDLQKAITKTSKIIEYNDVITMGMNICIAYQELINL